MDFENYKEGKSMQCPPFFEVNGFIYWKNRFETYVKSKDIDLWFIIVDGDNIATNTKDEDQKKLICKNNEAKMMLYNALPKKEYERIFMCKTAKDIWQSLIVTHQGNSQVKDNKIDLLIQDITVEYGITTIVISHDMNSVMRLGEYIIFLKDGKKVWEGNNQNLLQTEVPSLQEFLSTKLT